ncbi:MAG: hypothetical protein IKA17_09165 [Clostridia bacterium]|nr:hypothetical protein [Clostridia bacterium]
MIDIHTHILPFIDDGSPDCEVSIKMLSSLCEQGVSKVVLTPHFYAYRTDVESFVCKREISVNKLLDELKKKPVDISLYLGAEVLYFDEVWTVDNLDELTIKGTKYIMVEMPFCRWTDSMIGKISRLTSKGYIPIIAHIDRYIKKQKNFSCFYRLAEQGALLQVNTASVLSFFSRLRLKTLFKKGVITLFGTDCHNMEGRAPLYEESMQYIKKMVSKEQYQYMIDRQNFVLKEAQRIY